MIQRWLRFTAPTFPGSIYIAASLVRRCISTAVGGWVFIVGAIHEMRDRLPGMMTLISLAISVALVFSAAVTLGYLGEALWWELATLVTIMLFGHWIEMRSTFQASGALRELAKLLASTAQRVRGEQTRRFLSQPSPMETWHPPAAAR
jgi:Cu2+-exporting ATPase